MGTKTNPGAFNCYAAALPDEEIFTVLGRDPATPATIRFWIGERARLGKNVTEDDIDRLGQAAQVADNAEEWRARMLDPVGDGVPAWKLPRPRDLDDGPRVCVDPTAAPQITESTARWIQSNMLSAARLMRTSVEEGNGRDNFTAHDAARALTEIAVFLGVPAPEVPAVEAMPETLGYFGDGDEACRVSRTWLRGLALACRAAAGAEEDSRADAQCIHVAELLDLAAHSRTVRPEPTPPEAETDIYAAVAGGFCPTCGAPNYGGPAERRVGKSPALGAPYGSGGQERVLIDTAPNDLAHGPEVAPHRFSQFIKGEQYAYARGLEVSPQHLPVALDAMARDGWHLLAIFGQTDAKHIGFIFERGLPLGQERFSAFELAHGLGGGFVRDRPRGEPESDRMSAYHSGRPLDEIDGGGKDLTGACGLGRQQEP